MDKQESKNIVIVGAGFCGLQIAKHLAQKLKRKKEFRVLLIDKNRTQVYTADLYEISTAYNEKITEACLRALKESTTIDIPKSFQQEIKTHSLEFLQDEVTKINPAKKKVHLKKNGTLPYEYLVVTPGSVTNFYNIPGLEKNSFPLKTLEDALNLNCEMDTFFRERWKRAHGASLQKEIPVNIVIGGGGFTGIEYACELGGFIEKLARKYDFNEKNVHVSVIQGGDELIGLGKKVSDIAKKRLAHFNVRPILSTRIAAYDGKTLTLCNRQNMHKQSMPADMLIWTGGVKPSPLIANFPTLDPNGTLETKPTLETVHYPQVYAGGDIATIYDPIKGTPVPKLAQLAVQQGKIIASNIVAAIYARPPKTYKPLLKGFIMPMGGKYYVFTRGNVTITGVIPYLMKRFVDVNYFSQYMPLIKAIKKVIHSHKIFSRND